MPKFKSYLIKEEAGYLGHKVGDVLTSIQDLEEDMPNLGQRYLTRLAEDIVNQIRKILHGQWAARNIKHLKELQKVGVAIMRTIDERGDLKETLPAAAQQLQQISKKLGVKINNLDAPELEDQGAPADQSDFALTGDGPQQDQATPPLPPLGGQDAGM